MRRRGLGLIILAILASEIKADSAPPAPDPVKNRKELKANARKYAQQLHFLIEQVSNQYIRPVTREDLLEAALTGLYQAARRSPPHDLRAQIRQAVSLSGMMRNQVQAVQAFAQPPSDRAPTDPVEKLLVRLREEVGDPAALEGQNVTLLSCKAMTRVLDPHSGVVTAEEQRRNLTTDQESQGMGLTFKESLTPRELEVETVLSGSPAQRAGMRPGDVVTHLDDVTLDRAAGPKMLALRNNRPMDVMPDLALAVPSMDTTPQVKDLPALLKVTYRRSGETEPRQATLLRERFRAETIHGVRRREDNGWDWLADEKAGLAHLRLTNLGRGTGEELREVLAQLESRNVRGVVLDLRWCPGGYLSEAVEVADLFLGTCVVATVKNRGREDTVYRGTDEGKFRNLKLVVLINGETSGGAELIAAALQDHQRALIVGQRSLGKGSVQTPLSIGLESVGFKLTSGTFVRPNGGNLHRFPDSKPEDAWGVLPDEDARVSLELSKRLKKWWSLQSLRPARSLERLPLDDPRADPQQQLALDLLRRQR